MSVYLFDFLVAFVVQGTNTMRQLVGKVLRVEY
jgi:hypothetical protein